MSACIRVLKGEESWVLAAESVSGSCTSLIARLRPISGLVADRDGHEFHLSPYRFEGGDEWGVLGGLLLKPLVASEFLAESDDFDEDEVALLAVESARVRRRGVRYSYGVNEVGGCAVSLPEKGLMGLEG